MIIKTRKHSDNATILTIPADLCRLLDITDYVYVRLLVRRGEAGTRPRRIEISPKRLENGDGGRRIKVWRMGTPTRSGSQSAVVPLRSASGEHVATGLKFQAVARGGVAVYEALD